MLDTIKIPNFREGFEYCELSGPQGNREYRFKTKHSVIIQCNLVPKGKAISFRDSKNKEWVYIDSTHMIIMKGYAWDGCSPKRWIPLLGWVGTPDFEQTRLASLVHDALCQFLETEHFPFDRKVCDQIFKQILIQSHFNLVKLYYIGVRMGDYLGIKEDYDGVKSIILDRFHP